MMRSPIHCLVAALGLLPLIVAQCTTINPANPVVMASGYQSRVFINGLRTPRGITQDTLGNILVVEQGSGVRQIKITDNGGINVCAGATKQLISDNTVS